MGILSLSHNNFKKILRHNLNKITCNLNNYNLEQEFLAENLVASKVLQIEL